ncbi:MAG: hypothetical protein ACKOES_03035 [Planctomycetaceae bacterium]
MNERDHRPAAVLVQKVVGDDGLVPDVRSEPAAEFDGGHEFAPVFGEFTAGLKNGELCAGFSSNGNGQPMEITLQLPDLLDLTQPAYDSRDTRRRGRGWRW